MKFSRTNEKWEWDSIVSICGWVVLSVFVCMPTAVDCSHQVYVVDFVFVFVCFGQKQNGFSVSTENCYQNWTTGIDPKI